jgi:AraC-like DNA-binding protein
MAVRKARQLLQTTSMDMADIAAACGFATPNYFIASFFREYRVLPEEFRRQK